MIDELTFAQSFLDTLDQFGKSVFIFFELFVLETLQPKTRLLYFKVFEIDAKLNDEVEHIGFFSFSLSLLWGGSVFLWF